MDVGGGASYLPQNWIRPLVQAVVLPAHAQDSNRGAAAAAQENGCMISGDATGTSDTHNHVLTIPQADVENSTMAQTYATTGGTHSGQVSVAAADFDALRRVCAVTIFSNYVHPHVFNVTVARRGARQPGQRREAHVAVASRAAPAWSPPGAG